MFKREEKQIKSVLNSMLSDRSRFSDGLQKQNIANVWAAVMGGTIARYTNNIKLDKNTLYVNISSASLRNELIFEKEKIIEKLNTEMNHRRIDELVFR